MTILFYDGTIRDARVVEFSTDGKNIIVDMVDVIPLINVLRIFTK